MFVLYFAEKNTAIGDRRKIGKKQKGFTLFAELIGLKGSSLIRPIRWIGRLPPEGKAFLRAGKNYSKLCRL
jgi:hypothetical protein